MVLSEDFLSSSNELLAKQGLLDNGLKFRPIFFPDKFINHGKPEEQNIECGIDSKNIVNTVLNALGIASPAKFH